MLVRLDTVPNRAYPIDFAVIRGHASRPTRNVRRLDEHPGLIDDHVTTAVFTVAFRASARHEQVLAARDRRIVRNERERIDWHFDRALTLAFAHYVREEREQRHNRNQSDDDIQANFERFSHVVIWRNRKLRSCSAGRRLLYEPMA